MIGFNQSSWTINESQVPPFELFIYLVKEFNRPTEQTFTIQVNRLEIGGNIQTASPSPGNNSDYSLSLFSSPDGRNEELEFFKPNQNIVRFSMRAIQDDIVEGTEGFTLEISPVGETKFTVPTSSRSVFRQARITIRDDDREFVLN